MSVGIDVDAPELERLQQRLLKATRVDFHEMLEGIGGVVESQTRRRIQDEKSTPSGTRWREWSEKYAESQHGAENHAPHPGERRESQGHTLLSLSGALLDSIQFLRTFDEVEVGSNLKYANRQNEARQFVGLSDENNAEVLALVEDFLDQHLGLT